MSYANEWEDYSNKFWEEVEILATAHYLVFWQCVGTFMAPLGVSFHLVIEDQGLFLSAIFIPADLIGLCCVLGLYHCFKSCSLPLSLLLQTYLRITFLNIMKNHSHIPTPRSLACFHVLYNMNDYIASWFHFVWVVGNHRLTFILKQRHFSLRTGIAVLD